jgi:hypothetical protein
VLIITGSELKCTAIDNTMLLNYYSSYLVQFYFILDGKSLLVVLFFKIYRAPGYSKYIYIKLYLSKPSHNLKEKKYIELN